MSFCSNCGHQVEVGQAICLSCGFALPKARKSPTEAGGWAEDLSHNGKSRIATFLVAFFLGSFGAHRFMLGDKRGGWLYVLGLVSGMILLFPLLIITGFQLWDLYRIASTSADDFAELYSREVG